VQLSISGHHINVTDALKSYVTSKLDRLERHDEHITHVHVVLSVNKLVQRAEATLHTNGAEIFADAENEDLYAAVDALSDKLDRQIIKHKEKVGDHRSKTG
jgi:putative sigma-54 modulation protein